MSQPQEMRIVLQLWEPGGIGTHLSLSQLLHPDLVVVIPLRGVGGPKVFSLAINGAAPFYRYIFKVFAEQQRFLRLYLLIGKAAAVFRGVERGAGFQIKVHVAAQVNRSRGVITRRKIDGSTLDRRGFNGCLNRGQGVV